jgi:hypothetical protein
VKAAPVELPQHVADGGEWKAWPRKLEAHVRWGVRQRQIEAYVRNGRLTLYRCPDETLRLDPEPLREMFGEPDQVQGRDRDISATERRRRQSEAASGAELAGDPLVLMFNRATSMIADLHAQQISQLKGISDPLSALLGGYQTALQAAHARIATLETAAAEHSLQRIELDELRTENELRRAREAAAERRRDETLQLLKDQLPTLATTWLSGDSLSGFARRVPREVVEAIVESTAVSEQDSEILRRAAGIPKPAPSANPTSVNGVSSHGHS